MGVLVSLSLLIYTFFRNTDGYDRANIALNKPSMQSTTYTAANTWPSTWAVSSVANDGDRSNIFGAGKCTHTEPDQAYQWWTVDLGSSVVIDTITIYNRKLKPERLGNYDILVYDPEIPSWDNYDDNESIHCYHHIGTSPQILTLACSNPTKGRYVKIWRNGSAPMSICEVEIYTVTGLDVWNIQIQRYCQRSDRRIILTGSTHNSVSRFNCGVVGTYGESFVGFMYSDSVKTCTLVFASEIVETVPNEDVYYERC